MDLSKLKKFKIKVDTPIATVIEIEREEIIVHKYGEILFKTLKDKEKTALEIAVKPMFNRLSATQVISAIHVTDAEGYILYSSEEKSCPYLQTRV